MRFNFGCISNAILIHQQLSIDELDLVLYLFDFTFHHVEHVFETGYLSVFLPFLGLGLDLKIVLFLKNQVYFNCTPLLGQGLLIHPYLFLHLFVFYFDLLAVLIGLGHDRKGRLRFIIFLSFKFLELTLHGFNSLNQLIFLTYIAHNESKRIVEPK